MPSSFTPSLRLTLPVTGENSGTWGDLVNTGITNLVDASVAGYAAVTMTDANYTLTSVNGAADEARKMLLNISGTLTAARNVICPTASKLYFIKNATTGGFAITLKTSAGSGISVPNGRSMVLMCDGTNVVEAVNYAVNIDTTNLAYTGTLTGGTGVVNLGGGQFYKDASGNLGVGTAAPSFALDVVSAAAGIVRVRGGSGAGQGGAFFVRDAANTGTLAAFGDRARIFGGTPDALASIYTGALPLTFDIAGAERMRIDSSGNVGIGQLPNASQGRLQINQPLGSTIDGAIRVTDNSTTSMLINNTASGVSGIWTSGALAFGTGTTTFAERMRIDSSGNVGIGRTPTVRLDVNGGIAIGAPVTIGTGPYTVLATDYAIRVGGFATVTLPAPASFSGRILRFFNNSNGSSSASSASSNVVPIGSTTPGTVIIPNVGGKWAELQSDGTNWLITANN